MAEQNGLRYLVWDFNDLDVQAAQAEDSSYELYALVDGLRTDAQSWIYGGQNASDWTRPPQLPARGCE
jgi:hypothetical protein